MHGVNTRTMHSLFPRALVLSACATTMVVAGLSGQTLLGPAPSAVQHVTAETRTIPETVAAGKARSPIALHVDVTPKSRIHVYAPGAKDFSAVSLVITPRSGVIVGQTVYPSADPPLPDGDGVPVYRKTFRITQPITVQPGTVQSINEDVVVSGVVNYQACDDRLCYPVASLPVSWTIHVR
jgi:hypothetical protein